MWFREHTHANGIGLWLLSILSIYAVVMESGETRIAAAIVFLAAQVSLTFGGVPRKHE